MRNKAELLKCIYFVRYSEGKCYIVSFLLTTLTTIVRERPQITSHLQDTLLYPTDTCPICHCCCGELVMPGPSWKQMLLLLKLVIPASPWSRCESSSSSKRKLNLVMVMVGNLRRCRGGCYANIKKSQTCIRIKLSLQQEKVNNKTRRGLVGEK